MIDSLTVEHRFKFWKQVVHKQFDRFLGQTDYMGSFSFIKNAIQPVFLPNVRDRKSIYILQASFRIGARCFQVAFVMSSILFENHRSVSNQPNPFDVLCQIFYVFLLPHKAVVQIKRTKLLVGN